MARTHPESVSDYIAAQPEAVQPLLRRVRSAIHKGAAGVEESISYGIPTYKLRGRPVIYFAAWKRHFSIYPSTGQLVERFKDRLSRYEVEKGTIRFPLAEPAPERLIEAIARFRAEEVTTLDRRRKR